MADAVALDQLNAMRAAAQARLPIGHRGQFVKKIACGKCSGRGYFLIDSMVPDIRQCASPANQTQCLSCVEAYIAAHYPEANHD